MSVFEQILDKARAAPKRIVLPEGHDPRVCAAALRAKRHGIAEIVLLRGENTGSEDPGPMDNIEVIDPAAGAKLDAYAQVLYELRGHKGMTREQAQTSIRDPLTYANIMTRVGDADGCVAGARYTTSDVVRTALQLIGKHPNYHTVSSFFIMIFEAPHHDIRGGMIFADCALIIEPDAEQLSEIAIASADSAREFLGLTPRVALLSFSTAGSAAHPLVDKVIAATQRAQRLRPDIVFAGDVQLDAALIPAILEKKSDVMRLPGAANVLVFPGLESGNIGYKIAERMAGAQAIGPVLQGLNKPANDLSRGCSADDIYKIIAVTVVQGQNTALYG